MSGGAYSPLPGSDPDQTVAGGIHPNRVVRQKLGRPSNRVVVSLHVVFKLLALIIYFTQNNFIPTFILVMLLLSADFWTVKNICGRLLAGLRYWSAVEEESGEVVWHYESWTEEQRQLAQQGEITLFWAVLLGQQAVWSLAAAVCFVSLSLRWLLLCCLALCLNGSNLVGYTRARLGTGEALTTRLTAWLVTNILRRPRNAPTQQSI